MRLPAVGSLIVVSLALASSSSGRPSLTHREAFGVVYVSIIGTGGVRLGSGFVGPPFVIHCNGFWPGNTAYGSRDRITLTAIPAKGWKLRAWHGACAGSKLTCVVNLTHAPLDVNHAHTVHVTAVFVAVTPGLSRTLPVPLGKAANIADGFRLKVVSVTPSAHLSSPPPSGAQYFVANVAATYIGGGSGDLAPLYNNL